MPFQNCRDVEEEVCEEVNAPRCSRVKFDECRTVIKNKCERVPRDQLYNNRSSRIIDSRRLFSREYDFPKTFSLTENQFSGKTYFYTIASRENCEDVSRSAPFKRCREVERQSCETVLERECRVAIQ